MASGLKIAIVGGGSVAWTPRLVRDMMLKPTLKNAHFVLYDINKKASDLTRDMLVKLAKELNVKVKITSTDRESTALKGADYVLITISTGGLDAMAHDLAIPEKFGIYHTVGDSCGPGGWARLIRNFDVFINLGIAINKLAPNAVVLNYTNPMSTLTDVLARVCDSPVVGLCHGPVSSMAYLKRVYANKDVENPSTQYAGLNHFFFIREASFGKGDVIEDLNRKLRTKTLDQIKKAADKDPMGFESKALRVGTELMRITGELPYTADRHTCEFVPHIITNKQNLKKYKIVRTSIADRRRNYKRGRDHLIKMLKDGIPEEYHRASAETAADIVEAHSDSKVFIDVGNLPNVGQINNLPYGLVVETAIRVDANGFTPITYGELAPVTAGLIQPTAAMYQMVVDACFAGDRKLALQALRLDPLCSHLNWEQVQKLGDKLMGVHRKFIKSF